MAEETSGFDPMDAVQESKLTVYSHLHVCNPEKTERAFFLFCSAVMLWSPAQIWGKKRKIKRHFYVHTLLKIDNEKFLEKGLHY